MSFWNAVWLIIVSFAFVAYLMVLFSVFGDLFRDGELSGAAKAVWIVALIVAPFLAAVIYLIVRGGGMVERSARDAAAAREQTDAYIRDVATAASPADQISKAQTMLAQGVISQPEYDRLKEKALA